MKILYVCTQPDLSQYSQSGPGTHMREMIAAFKEQDCEVQTFIFGDRLISSSSESTTDNKKGIKFFIKKLTPSIIWESLKDYFLLQHNEKIKAELLQVVKNYQPDFIYERASYLQYITTTIAQQQNIKVILEINAPFADQRKNVFGNTCYYSKAKKIEQQIAIKANTIFVVSSVLKDYYSNLTNSDKIHVLPNAFNLQYLKTDSGKVVEIKKENAIEGNVIIGFVGSIFPYHGVDLLITAFITINEKHPDISLLIVGDGMILKNLKQLVKNKKAKDRIHFTGSVPNNDVFNYIKSMDICVMPKSNWYGSPVKIFEYGAFGKPIIAPNVQPVSDVMENDIDGMLIQPTVDELIKSLNFMIDNREEAVRMGKSFQSKVLKKHTWLENAKKVLQTI